MFWSVGWPLLRAEGFFCNFDILYGGLVIGKLQLFIKKKLIFFSVVIFFLNFWSLKPWIRIWSGSGSVFILKCWCNECGSATLINSNLFEKFMLEVKVVGFGDTGTGAHYFNINFFILRWKFILDIVCFLEVPFTYCKFVVICSVSKRDHPAVVWHGQPRVWNLPGPRPSDENIR